MKILLIGGGRRVELCRMFQDEGFEVHSYELDNICPISTVANKIITDKPNYYYYDAVLPMSCKFLYKNEDYLGKFSPSLRCVGMMTDKKMFEQFILMSTGIRYPITELGKGFVSKPRFGEGSSDIFYGSKASPINTLDNNRIFQYRLRGMEYSVDCYFSTKGELFDFRVRERNRVAGSEVYDSTIVKDDQINDLVIKFAKSLNENSIEAYGPITLQFIKDENGVPFITEANARIGGGAPLSIKSGMNIPKYIKSEILGKPLEKDRFKNLAMKRYMVGYYYEQSK